MIENGARLTLLHFADLNICARLHNEFPELVEATQAKVILFLYSSFMLELT